MYFKVGDWVRVNSGQYEINQIANVFYTENDVSLKFISAKMFTPFDEVELWAPQPGEWCWFYFSKEISDHNCLTIGRFIRFRDQETHDLYIEYYDTDNNIFAADICEPFIGTPPSFLKE